MAYDRAMAEKFKQALAGIGEIDETQMFGSFGFMINGKLAVAVGNEDVMFKVGQKLASSSVDSKRAKPVSMNGRTMKSWIVVENQQLKAKVQFDEWLSAAVRYNHANS